MLTFALVIIALVGTGQHQVGISFKNYKSNLLVVIKHETLVLILQSPTRALHPTFGVYFFPSSMFALACKLAPAELDSWNGNINFYAWKRASCTGGVRGCVHGVGREGCCTWIREWGDGYMEQRERGCCTCIRERGDVYVEQGEKGGVHGAG